MIIEGLLHLVYWLLSLLLAPIHIEELPANVATVIETLVDSVEAGLKILSFYCHLGYILTLFSIAIGIELAMMLYRFIRWLLQKIPMANVE